MVNERTVEEEKASGSHGQKVKHHRHLIELGETFEDGDEDQVMVFKDGTDANSVLSLWAFEILIFTSQFIQLVVDFYLGFYIVHIRKRIGVAYGPEAGHDDHRRLAGDEHAGHGDGQILPQILFHVAILLAVFSVLYLLMIFTRNIALLVGVLHLNEKSVSDVLQHMELVKSIRQRIHETLASTKIVHSNPDPAKAAQVLDNAEKGEVAILKLLGAKGKNDRITGQEMENMIRDHEQHLTMTQKDLARFLGPSADPVVFLRLPLTRVRAHRPRGVSHLRVARAGPAGHSTDRSDAGGGRGHRPGLSRGVGAQQVRHALCGGHPCRRRVAGRRPGRPRAQGETHASRSTVAEALDLTAHAVCAQKLRASIVALDSIDEKMMESAEFITQTKAVFRASDRDKSGELSRTELLQALRKFKVAITKKEYKEVFRVIDPDQSHKLNLDEWVDFMTSTDAGLNCRKNLTRAVAKEESSFSSTTSTAKVAPEP